MCLKRRTMVDIPNPEIKKVSSSVSDLISGHVILISTPETIECRVAAGYFFNTQ